MVRTTGLTNYSDVHFTSREIAKEIVDWFSPGGRILEPFRGDGAFYDVLPAGTDWCELAKGRDFFDWTEPVDWIITNPPFSNLTKVMAHCFNIATYTVLLVPMSKIYSSKPRLDLVRKVAGIEEQYILGTGRSIGFDIGFPFAAMRFSRGYHGGRTTTTWSNNVLGQ